MKKILTDFITNLKKVTDNNYIVFLFIILSYLTIDIIFRYAFVKWINYYSITNISTILFDLSIIFFNIFIMCLLKRKVRIIYYSFTIFFYIIMSLVHYYHFKILGTVFTFSEIFLMSEGLDYVNTIIEHTSLKIILVICFILMLFILTTILIIKNKEDKVCFKNKLLILLISIVLQLIGVVFLYVNNNGYNKNDESSPIYNYKNFRTPYQSLQVTGMLQYPIQDSIMYIANLYKDKINMVNNKKELEDYLKSNKYNTKNEYTGIFKDKNLIYIMLESGDDWLINQNDMPTLYKMQQEGWNFTNRFAPQFYTGYTFNSEFAANTGLYSMDGYDNYKNNYFPYSLPNLFKTENYKVNSFHMNNKEFYSRDEYHKSFGYTNFYSGYYKDKTYEKEGYSYLLDSDWVDNDETYNKLVSKDEKFMSFLITYTMHMTYMNNSICNEGYRKGKVSYDNYNKIEENCLRYLAKQSDKLFERLLERLEEDNLIDDTIIIVFSDHYAYGITDIEFLSKQKGTDNKNLFQKTPLIIWGKNIDSKEIVTLMDTADLVPTIANLFGLEYDTTNYISTDVFSENHQNFVYFQYGAALNSQHEYISNYSKSNKLINYNKYILQTNY